MLPPPCEELTTSDPRRRATRVKPSRHQRDIFAIQNVRTQIDVPRLRFAFQEARCARKTQRRLRDVIPRLGLDPLPEFFPLLGGAVRADQHAVAARLAHGFHHQLVQILQHIAALRAIGQQVRLDVRQNGIFVRDSSG